MIQTHTAQTNWCTTKCRSHCLAMEHKAMLQNWVTCHISLCWCMHHPNSGTGVSHYPFPELLLRARVLWVKKRLVEDCENGNKLLSVLVEVDFSSVIPDMGSCPHQSAFVVQSISLICQFNMNCYAIEPLVSFIANVKKSVQYSLNTMWSKVNVLIYWDQWAAGSLFHRT